MAKTPAHPVQGKVVLVNFWHLVRACYVEIPWLIRCSRSMSESFTVVGISMTKKQVRRRSLPDQGRFNVNGQKFPILSIVIGSDESPISSAAFSLSHQFLISRDGRS